MPVVIADTSPLNYLLLIGHIEILPVMFQTVVVPAKVRDELSHRKAPAVVRNWIQAPPEWVEIRSTADTVSDPELKDLDPGERMAIHLALELEATLVLMDDEEGVLAARRRGLEVTGTLGVLSRAAQRDLIHLPEAFDRMRRTNFRYKQEIMDQFLRENRNL